MNLVQTLAKACMYAQEHIDAENTGASEREYLLQCTSFQIACFLAQNTYEGEEGVEWDIIIDELVAYPMKDEETWQDILNRKAEDYGGWKEG